MNPDFSPGEVLAFPDPSTLNVGDRNMRDFQRFQEALRRGNDKHAFDVADSMRTHCGWVYPSMRLLLEKNAMQEAHPSAPFCHRDDVVPWEDDHADA